MFYLKKLFAQDIVDDNFLERIKILHIDFMDLSRNYDFNKY